MSNDDNKFDKDLLKANLSQSEISAKEQELRAELAKQFQIKQPIEEYLGTKEQFYRNYFDLEGGNFPDLFTREYTKDKTDVQNDCDSRVKNISANRPGRFYGDLMVAAFEAKRQKELKAINKNLGLENEEDRAQAIRKEIAGYEKEAKRLFDEMDKKMEASKKKENLDD